MSAMPNLWHGMLAILGTLLWVTSPVATAALVPRLGVLYALASGAVLLVTGVLLVRRYL